MDHHIVPSPLPPPPLPRHLHHRELRASVAVFQESRRGAADSPTTSNLWITPSPTHRPPPPAPPLHSTIIFGRQQQKWLDIRPLCQLAPPALAFQFPTAPLTWWQYAGWTFGLMLRYGSPRELSCSHSSGPDRHPRAKSHTPKSHPRHPLPPLRINRNPSLSHPKSSPLLQPTCHPVQC